jgi:hypothetical protein
VTGFLFVAHQQSTTLGKPRQCPFHHPAAGWIGPLPVGLESFLSDASDMGRLWVCGDGFMAGRIIVALV